MPLEERKKNPNLEEEEIDLFKFFNYIFSFFKGIFLNVLKFVFIFFDSLINKWKLILLLTLTGILLGIGYFYYAKPYYESSMTLSSAYYNGEFLNNSINNLDRLCKEQNYEVLASLLNIPKSKAQKLKKVGIEPTISPNTKLLIDLYKETEGSKRRLDSLILNTNDSTYQVKVQVFDTRALIGLDTLLINYIKKNKFVDKRIAIERKNLLARKAKLIRESKNLDTLKNNISKSYLGVQTAEPIRPNGTNVTLNNKEVNPIDIYKEDFSIYEQQLQIDKLLYINSEIEVIDKFIIFNKPANTTMIEDIFIGALTGFVFGLVIIFLSILRKGLYRLKQTLNIV